MNAKILNPLSVRFVLKTGVIGKKLLTDHEIRKN